MQMPHGIGWWPERWARIDPQRPAVIFEEQAVSWRELSDRIDVLGGYLEAKGVGPGSTVALLMDNRPEFLAAFWAVVRAGAVFVPLSPRLASNERAYILDAAHVDFVISEQALSHGSLGGRPTIVIDDPSVEAELAKFTYRAQFRELSLDAPLAVLFTSGTTGRPKGAVITHGAVLFSTLNLIIGFGLSPADVHLVTLPLCYTGGLISSALMAFHSGGTILLERKFDAGRALRLIREQRPSVMLGVPTMYTMMREHQEFDETDLTSFRLMSCGGAPASSELAQAYHRKGAPMVHPYGITEGAGSSSVLPTADAISRHGSVGPPGLYCEVVVHDEHGDRCASDEVGEIVLAGPQIMAGYLDNPQATAEVMDGRWFRTGDLGREDRDGYIYVVGRTKDMMISGGFNVYPLEIENVITELPWVVDCAVVGIPDPRWGDEVVAAITVKEDAHTEAEVQAHCRSRIAGYKVPKRVVFLDSLPRGESGKVVKRQLRSDLEVVSRVQQ